MSAALTRLVLWDVRLQARERIYAFTAMTTLFFGVFVWLMRGRAPDTVLSAVLFLDPAVVGTTFVAAVVLLERSQNTLVALAVTPVSPSAYVLAKVVTLTVVTFAGGMVVVAAAYWPVPVDRALRFVLAMTCTGALGVCGGLVIVATANSLNHVIARAFPISVVLYLPFLAHFGVVTGGWKWILFGLNPGHAMMRSLLWAARPANVSLAEAIYAFAYMAILIALLFAWARRLYVDNIARTAE